MVDRGHGQTETTVGIGRKLIERTGKVATESG
jgi:hypothetical protein